MYVFNTIFNGIRPVDPFNAPIEESVARGHGRGKGRARPRGRVRERVEPIGDGASDENST